MENQCKTLLQKGALPADVALFCLRSVQAALEGMTSALFARYGKLPLLFAGGVMSNSFLKHELATRFGGHFAPPEYSADNAAGIAVLTALQHEG